jgi:hypothetical protein
MYLKLKSIYKSGCVIKYSPFLFSKATGISRNTVKKYMDIFISEGWVTRSGNNVTFIAG